MVRGEGRKFRRSSSRKGEIEEEKRRKDKTATIIFTCLGPRGDKCDIDT